MGSKALLCGEKNSSHQKIKPISIDEVEIKRIMLFNKNSYSNKGSFKYYIRYMHEGKAFPSPLYIKLPQLIGLFKCFNNHNNDELTIKNC